MQWRDSINKSPKYLNVAENKFDTGDLFMKGENHRGKTPSSEFKVITLDNPLLSITSGYKYKKSYQSLWSILKYQSIVELLPNTQLDLYCSSNLFVQCTNSCNGVVA